jgi:peptidoglycan/xylan/chitin deacetylase (PgdA/CDA1 family)
VSLILLYHRVAAPSLDPYDLAVHPDRFSAHIEHLLRLNSAAPLDDLLERGSDRRIAITFDDGYADNAIVAAPLLADAGLPATWFITTGTLGQRRFWWDRLAEAMLGSHPLPHSIDVDVADRTFWLDLRSLSARRNALLFLHRRLLPLPSPALEAAVDRITGQLGSPEATNDNLTMTVEQLRELARLPLQHVGAHTRTHAHLNGQAPDRQRDEILGSVADLESILQRPVRDFAYPFGGPDTVGTLAPRLVEEAGCRLGCTTTPGSVRRRGDPYRLPRLTVFDWAADEFAARVNSAISSG